MAAEPRPPWRTTPAVGATRRGGQQPERKQVSSQKRGVGEWDWREVGTKRDGPRGTDRLGGTTAGVVAPPLQSTALRAHSTRRAARLRCDVRRFGGAKPLAADPVHASATGLERRTPAGPTPGPTPAGRPAPPPPDTRRMTRGCGPPLLLSLCSFPPSIWTTFEGHCNLAVPKWTSCPFIRSLTGIVSPLRSPFTAFQVNRSLFVARFHSQPPSAP